MNLGTCAMVRSGLVDALANTQSFVISAFVDVDAGSAVAAQSEAWLAVTTVRSPQISAAN